VIFLVCSVPGCPEYCRAFVDLRNGEESATPWRA
jgi:hypothetical protein